MARCVYCSPFQVADLEEGTSSRRLTVSWETSYGYDPMLSASFLSLFFFFFIHGQTSVREASLIIPSFRLHCTVFTTYGDFVGS